MGSRILQKPRSHLKILGTRRVTWNQFHTENPQILGATLLSLVAMVTDARDLCVPTLILLQGVAVVYAFEKLEW